MRASRRKRRRRRPACRPLPTIPALWSMRSTARPAFIRRAGPDLTRISARRWKRSNRSCSERGATTPAQRKAHFVSALCVAWPDGHVEEFEAPRRRHARLAAARRQGLRLRSDVPARRPRAHLRRDAERREARPAAAKAKGCRIAPAPSSNSRRRVLASDLTGVWQRDDSAAIRRLRALAVLPVEMPLLRFQQPCAPRRRSTRRALCAPSRARSPRPPRACRAATVSTIFFGGGTPSLMQPATVGAILDAIARHWRVAPDVEVTLEANPTSVEAARFRGYRAAGVNRVSLGVQALDDRVARRARPAAFGARSARRGAHRAQRLRALFVRSDLRAAAADAAGCGRTN